jgi:hypothetical protein
MQPNSLVMIFYRIDFIGDIARSKEYLYFSRNKD